MKQDTGSHVCRQTVTMKDIAKQCGVSTYTVSRALNKMPGVNKDTAARVLATAQSLGFNLTQNGFARQLAFKRHGTTSLRHAVGLIMPDGFYRAPYFMALFQGVMDVITNEQYSVISTVISPPETPTSQHVMESLPYAFTHDEIDGLIVTGPPQHYAPMFEQLRKETPFGDRPIVSMVRPIPGCHHMLADNRRAGKLIVEHLLALGHRHIAYFEYYHGRYETDERKIGYRQACEEAGLDANACLTCLHFPDSVVEETVEKVLPDFLKMHPHTTAIIALTDPIAIVTYYVLKRMGITVPDDLSLVGFDNSDPLYVDNTTNLLTSVEFSLLEIGHQSARLLLQYLESPSETTTEAMPFPAQLVVRASTSHPLRH